MQLLRNPRDLCIFLGVLLQSLCSIKLVWLNDLLTKTSSASFSLSYPVIFLYIWSMTTFISRVTGGYIFGKYAEARGFLAAQKILVLGYVLTTFLFFLCCAYATHLHQIRPMILILVYFNVLLFPATLILPAVYLMKCYSTSSHVKIGALLILASVLGYVLSYIIANEYNTQKMSLIICGAGLLCGIIYFFEKKILQQLEESAHFQIKKRKKISQSYKEKFLATLVGGVCGAGMTHNYFFIEPYALNVSIINAHTLKVGYISFYIAIGVFLLLAAKACDYLDHGKLMIRSLFGILLTVASLKILDISINHLYVAYQVVFAFFFAGFLAPSSALIFSLFKENQPFFNSIIWYYLGLSFSYLTGYFLSNGLGIFQQYFLFVTPLALSCVLCLIVMKSIKKIPQLN